MQEIKAQENGYERALMDVIAICEISEHEF
jgi:hypothetical protein